MPDQLGSFISYNYDVRSEATCSCYVCYTYDGAGRLLSVKDRHNAKGEEK